PDPPHPPERQRLLVAQTDQEEGFRLDGAFRRYQQQGLELVPGEFAAASKRRDDAAELPVQLDRRTEGRIARFLVLEVADDLQRDVGVVWPSHPYRQLDAARTGQRR